MSQLLRGSDHQFKWALAPRRQPARTPGGATFRAPARNSTARTVRLPPTGSRHAGQSVDSPTRYLKENSELRQKLIEAENKLAELEPAQLQKRLSAEQKRFLIEALRPFAGQKVSIASIAAMTRDCSSPRNSCPCSKLPVGTTTAKPAYPLRNGRATLWGSRWS